MSFLFSSKNWFNWFDWSFRCLPPITFIRTFSCMSRWISSSLSWWFSLQINLIHYSRCSCCATKNPSPFKLVFLIPNERCLYSDVRHLLFQVRYQPSEEYGLLTSSINAKLKPFFSLTASMPNQLSATCCLMVCMSYYTLKTYTDMNFIYSASRHTMG